MRNSVRSFSKGICAVLLLLTLCSCGKQGTAVVEAELPAEPVSSAPETTAASAKAVPKKHTVVPTEPPATEPEPEPEPPLPVLSITTNQQGGSALDFVTKPIVSHVAETVSSWSSDYQIPPVPFDEACTVTLTDTDSTVLIGNAEADVRVRGNWTTYYPKKPLRIHFAEKQEMLGLNDSEKMRTWVLLAEYKDPSLLRNRVMLSAARELLGADDLYAADSTFVEVQINGEYWGVYLLTEQQQVNKHRIDITKPEQDSKDTNIGYLLEYDGYSVYEDELHRFTIDYANNAPLVPFDGNNGTFRKLSPKSTGYGDAKRSIGFSIKSDIYAPEQRDFIAGYMSRVYQIMYAAAYEKTAYRFNEDYSDLVKADITPQEAVEQVVDVQSLADMYILSELAWDADLNWSSFFMDVDFGENGNKKLTFEAPWDFDSALGNKERAVVGKGFYAANIIPDMNDEFDTIHPWLAVLIYEDWFQERIRVTWTKACEDGVFERACTRIGEESDAYAEAFLRNCERWGEDCSDAHEKQSCGTQRQEAEKLSKWFRERVDFLNGYWYDPELLETETMETEIAQGTSEGNP